ncbi:MAG: glutaminyl-tRNA synthase (glutamine-hydrolyzing) subunit A [Candidatus Wildermuthbacteria bacterium GWA2_46_15]|uniref:Glutamyl-tRNA(Gln) amidotransferase subunit A n=1 Tax=Candidatus Wildermuthbacteria bacterium GWA2_46_15 TaxID=1802443 RepID=A0A1G2QR49_9BACT|nr:MAG: glutaminyl-tRNA synthase (glutamine-hydrolyzing) subunit A [Candidatus Wildermuthbacteria bacterium GWA2_46_15]
MNLNELSLTEVLEGIEKKRFSPQEIFADCQKRIKEVDEKTKAFITVIAETRNAIPFAIKDNFCTENIRTTASSNILRDYIPPYNATVYQRLIDAQFGLLGKTNMDSFAHGSSTETSDFFVTHNPWNLERLPGGSSGGSAAAVMADETIFAIGSETAGSIRQPSAWCGVVGLKPSYGRVSRYGVIAMGSSLDCPGPITKTVADAEIIYKTIAGKDPLDATTVDRSLVETSSFEPKKIRIGLAKEYLEVAEKPVRQKILEAAEVFRRLGCSVVEVSLFDPRYAISVYTILQRSEVSSNLARYDGIRYGSDRTYFNKENKRRIMLGTYTLSAGYYDAYYLKAQKIRTVICQDFEKAFEKLDVIIGPVSPSPAKRIGASTADPMFGEKEDVLVEPSTIAGLPAISLPAGFVDGLPVGLQIIGNRWQEDLILNLGKLFETETQYYKIKPKL